MHTHNFSPSLTRSPISLYKSINFGWLMLKTLWNQTNKPEIRFNSDKYSFAFFRYNVEEWRLSTKQGSKDRFKRAFVDYLDEKYTHSSLFLTTSTRTTRTKCTWDIRFLLRIWKPNIFHMHNSIYSNIFSFTPDKTKFLCLNRNYGNFAQSITSNLQL